MIWLAFIRALVEACLVFLAVVIVTVLVRQTAIEIAILATEADRVIAQTIAGLHEAQ